MRWLSLAIVALLAGCSTGPDAPPEIARVNGYVNTAHYVRDVGQTFVNPDKFMERGGDCEDYAMTKYWFLKRGGQVAPENMELVVLMYKGVLHAVLQVRDGRGGVWYLDNLRPFPMQPSWYSGPILYRFDWLDIETHTPK